MKKLKIISDGTSENTQMPIGDVDILSILPVESIDIIMRPNEPVKARLLIDVEHLEIDLVETDDIIDAFKKLDLEILPINRKGGKR